MAAPRPFQPICVDDFEELASQSLPRSFFYYFSDGADDGQTLNDNMDAFKRIRLRPRVMRDVSNRDMSTTILGQRIPFPIAVAPTALHCMAHPDGERATARAAELVNAGMALSTWSSVSMEDVAKSAPKGLRWLQLNLFKDRDVVRNFVKRAERLGYKALFVTMDKPETAKKRRTMRSDFDLEIPDSVTSANFDEAGVILKTDADADKLRDPSITWETINWLRSITTLPLVAKGILTAEDAREAVKHKMSAILVSNHGGRQLDGVRATIDALPEVVQAVKGSGVEVYMDGGVRKGTDVLKALALGARVVFVGRPIIWGLAYNGKDGVKRVVEILRDEFSVAMALTGCRSVEEITKDLVERKNMYSSNL